MSRRAVLVRVAALGAIVVATVLLQLWVGLPSEDELRGVLERLGPAAIPAFIGVYVLVCLLPAGPTALVTIVGGALLGFAVGLPTVLAGAVLGSAAAFGVSRVLGRPAAARIPNERVRSLDRRVGEHGFAAVIFARLVPLIPFSTANYAFGLTSVSWRSYLPATAIGILPGTAIYVAVGAFGTRPGSWPFLLAIAGLILLSLIGFLRARRSRDDAAVPAVRE